MGIYTQSIEHDTEGNVRNETINSANQIGLENKNSGD